MSAGRDGLHINSTTLIALGVIGFIIAPSLWTGYKLRQAIEGPNGRRANQKAVLAGLKGMQGRPQGRAK